MARTPIKSGKKPKVQANKPASPAVQPDSMESQSSDTVAEKWWDSEGEPRPAKNKRRQVKVKDKEPVKLPSKRPSKRVTILMETAAMGLALAGLFAGYLAWRLSVGTVSISAATPLVEDALFKLIGSETKIGTLRLGWDTQRRDFIVFAGQITASTGARTAPLRLGRVDLALDAPRLLLGQAVVKNAQLSGVEAVLVMDNQGRTAFGFGTAEEVLALPRAKGKEGGLRRALLETRKALDPQGQGGRVETVTLTNATLQLIDPDTNHRVLISNAQARVLRGSAGILTLQGSGAVNKVGGTVNVALSASPNPDLPLAFSAIAYNLGTQDVLTSLRKNVATNLNKFTAPLSGRGLLHLTTDGKLLDAQARFSLGRGAVPGFMLQKASGTLAWNALTGTVGLTDLAAEGQGLRVVQGNVLVARGPNATRPVRFDAKELLVTQARLGAISATKLSGQGVVDSQSRLRGGVTKSSQIAATSPEGFRIGLTNADITFTTQGDGIAFVSNTESGQSPTFGPFRANLKSGGFELSDAIGAIANGEGAVLAAEHRPTGGYWIETKINSASFIGRGNQIPQVAAQGINFTATDVRPDGVGTLVGQIRQMTTRQTGASGLGVAGQNVNLMLSRSAPQRYRIDHFKATEFAFNNPIVSMATRGVSLVAELDVGNLRNAKFAANLVTLSNTRQIPRPFVAEDVRFEGQANLKSIDLASFGFRHRGISATGSFALERAPRGSPKVDLDAQISGSISIETLLSAWPRSFIPDTRSAIAHVVRDGTGTTNGIRLALPPGLLKGQHGSSEAIALDFSFVDGSVDYLPGMSRVTNVSGNATLTGNSFQARVDRGKVGAIEIKDAVFDIPKFLSKRSPAVFTGQISGPVLDMAQEIDKPPLRLLSSQQFEPNRLGGEAVMELSVGLPLAPRIEPEEIDVKVHGTLDQASLTKVLGNLDANDGTVTLDVNQNAISVAGQAWLVGNMFDFNWQASYGGISAKPTTLTAAGALDLASLVPSGIDVTRYATGPVGLKIEADSIDGKLLGADIRADFIGTTIIAPANVWSKSEGTAANGSAHLVSREGGGWTLQNLKLDSSDVEIRGGLDLSEQLGLQDARFSKIAIANTADVSVNVTQSDRALTVSLVGDFLDLSAFLAKKDVSERAVDILDRPLSLFADIKKLATGAGSTLNDVHADVLRDQTGWRSLTATGSSETGTSHLLMRQELDGRRKISGQFSDAGFFARLLYPGATINGGTGTIEGELPVVGAESSGTLVLKAEGVSFGKLGQSPVLFDLVNLPMIVNGGVISLREGRADGAAYTVKAAGYVDLEDGKLDIRGVATPGGLNRALGALPVFGGLLGGGSDEGLLGITFAARGTLVDPKLRTNPISALAPGFLRRLFESEAPLEPPTRLKRGVIAGDPAIKTDPDSGPPLDH